MSQTFSLVCEETKQKVWVGQGWKKMTIFYSGEPETMDRLGRFLCEHEGKLLRFLCDEEHGMLVEYTEYGEALECLLKGMPGNGGMKKF